MATTLSLPDRLIKVLVPTRIQAALCLILALTLLAGAQFQQLLLVLGLDIIVLEASRTELDSRFSQILTTQIASTTALVTFWAGVGLIAYLICWGAYNFLIEARNKVTLEVQYTNQGQRHWRGVPETFGLKALGGISLVCLLALLKPGIALWLALVAPMLGNFTLAGIGMALLATLGLAAQLYLILACALLTFTPWYREEAFTDATE